MHNRRLAPRGLPPLYQADGRREAMSLRRSPIYFILCSAGRFCDAGGIVPPLTQRRAAWRVPDLC